MAGVGKTIIVLCGGGLLWAACNKGVEPPSQGGSGVLPTGPGAITGTIKYRNWPQRDSLVDLRIVVFNRFPPTDIVHEVISGNAVVYPPLGDTALVPFYVDSLRYKVILNAGTYPYVVVAQQFANNVLTDWRPVGQYDLDSNLLVPSPVTVAGNDTTRNINISVDFVNRPPPPF